MPGSFIRVRAGDLVECPLSNLITSFHVIGEIFDVVGSEAGTAENRNVQTTLAAPRVPVPSERTKDKRVKLGAVVYQRVCVACHQPKGDGIPQAFPPLAGSDYRLRRLHALRDAIEPSRYRHSERCRLSMRRGRAERHGRPKMTVRTLLAAAIWLTTGCGVTTPERPEVTPSETSEQSGIRELSAALEGSFVMNEDGNFAHSNQVAVIDRDGRMTHIQTGLGVDPGGALEAIRHLMGR